MVRKLFPAPGIAGHIRYTEGRQFGGWPDGQRVNIATVNGPVVTVHDESGRTHDFLRWEIDPGSEYLIGDQWHHESSEPALDFLRDHLHLLLSLPDQPNPVRRATIGKLRATLARYGRKLP